ncbi:single-stranded DNA-binding protein [Streptococcus didelphis]|uniref:Single-stranded DNA-binding protein n=1 Tax=Streptococcus didelphis TaxID=102886 RepID=A0ABY9LIJ5_9STRE|nr:single-stranded DNA-binding protein [Streptococcus didelphis]WMB28659.1 single-stranded DNA-binding protein [Streptococcus didelphis]
MNNTNLIGRLTKKAELYQTPDKKTYARFTIAINRKRKQVDREVRQISFPVSYGGKQLKT